MLDNTLSFLTICQNIVETTYRALELYNSVGAIIRGSEIDAVEKNSGRQLNPNSIERLADNILYAPNIYVVENLSSLSKTQQLEEVREIRSILEPIQRTIGGEILSSAMIRSPRRMQDAMIKNPWEVLINISPLAHPNVPSDPHLIPILFEYESIQFLGWQKSGILPSLFDISYNKDAWNMSKKNMNISGEKLRDGELKYSDGSRYEGEISNNKANGWGVMIFSDGGKLEGRWQNGEYQP